MRSFGFSEDDDRLSKQARDAISDPGNDTYVSDATAWEAGIKQSLRKLTLPVPYEDLFPGLLESAGFITLPIRHSHLHRMVTLPRHHGDPFDRLMIAQAFVEGLTILTWRFRLRRIRSAFALVVHRLIAHLEARQ